MKQLSFTSNFLLKKIQQSKLIILIFTAGISNTIFAQQIINNGASIVMNGATSNLVVNNASFINNGKFTSGTGTVTFSGDNDCSIGTSSGTTGNTTTFYNLTHNNTSTYQSTGTGTGVGITVNPNVQVANTLSVINGGTLNTSSTTAVTNGTAGNLTLLSTVANTANVSSVNGKIYGNVNVQRYIPAYHRAWRLLTAPVYGNNSIFSTWQNSGVNNVPATPNNNGLGMYISGPAAVNIAPTSSNGNGLDYSAGKTSSMKSWSGTAFVPVTNTNTTTLSMTSNSATSNNSGTSSSIGYFVFVRGDRTNSNFTPPNTSVTTLTSIGQLQSYNQYFYLPSTTATSNFVLVGNPYASQIDFTLLSLKNVNTTFYTWDATQGTLGGYITHYINTGGTYSSTPNTYNTTVIQSGQAFFVQAASALSSSNNGNYVKFNEASKVSNGTAVNSNISFRPMVKTAIENTFGSFSSSIFLLQHDSTTKLADASVTQFGDSFSDSVLLPEDATKLYNINETFGLSRHGVLLAVESRPTLTINDTIFLHLSQATKRAYQFKFVPNNLDKLNLIGILQDKYLNTSAKISLTDITAINFSLDGNAASATPDRFQIVFKTFLPFGFTNIAAVKNNKDISVTWNVANETNILQYEIEKTYDGVIFTKVATQTVVGNNNAVNNYNWLDKNAIAGDNIYRVKMISQDGHISYTTLAIVNIAPTATGMFVYPNPVKNSKINLQMSNQPIGKYQLSVTAANGQIIYTGEVLNAGNNSQFVLTLTTKVAKGMYNLQITTPQDKIVTQKLIVE